MMNQSQKDVVNGFGRRVCSVIWRDVFIFGDYCVDSLRVSGILSETLWCGQNKKLPVKGSSVDAEKKHSNCRMMCAIKE